jgi:hypothetical protein
VRRSETHAAAVKVNPSLHLNVETRDVLSLRWKWPETMTWRG